MKTTDNGLLTTEIEKILKVYHAPSMRYQNLAFSSKDFFSFG